jgi:long-chain acyl-CoA synthetase
VGHYVQKETRVNSFIFNDIEAFALANPDAPAILFEGRARNYSEFTSSVESTARKILELGVKRGDRVGISAENSLEYLVLSFGIWRAGAVVATLFPAFGPSELEYALQSAAPVLVFADEERYELMTNTVRRILPGSRVINFGPDDILAGVEEGGQTLPIIQPEELATICFTSGTTSHPKAIAHSHANMAINCRLIAREWHVGPTDSVLVATPLSWLHGLQTCSMMGLSRGARIVLLRRFNTANALTAFAEDGITFFFGVTTMIVKMVDRIRETGHVPAFRVRFTASGGEPRNEPAFDEWYRLTGSAVYDNYCSTECFPLVTYDPVRDGLPRIGSAGRLIAECELKLLDPEGRPVPPGIPGEAFARSPARMIGYWNEPEMTRAAVSDDGWYRTRDLVRIDEDGFVYVVGRTSDMILRGGANISPLEIETILNAHPSVGEAVVVPLPDRTYGQIVAAAITPAPHHAFDEQELRAYCSRQLAAYKVPAVFVMMESFPRNASSKIIRKDVVAAISDQNNVSLTTE